MTIEFEEWFEKFKPRKNRISKDALYNGHMFETCGHDIQFLRDSKVKNEYLWTIVDCDNEEQYIIPGWYVVNRAGYFITKIPWKEEDLQVNLNEMITTGAAKYACMEFLESLGIEESLYEDKIHDFFSQKF